MYSRVANDAPSSRIDHPERTARRLCRTPQPTLSSTSAVAGSDRAESTLGSRPPAPRALDGSIASTAPPHARWQGVRPGIRAVSERASSPRALPARPPQVSSGPSSRYTRTAATANGSSREDDSVTQGKSYLSFPLSAAAEDDTRSYTRRATYSPTEGGARVHPPVMTHPRGMEGVRTESRTSPAAYWPGDSRFAFEPATAADAFEAGEHRARRVVMTRPATFATSRAPPEQEGDTPIYPSGTPQGQLHDAAGRDLKLRTRRALYSATEGGACEYSCSTHPRGLEDVSPQSRTPPSVASSPTLGHYHQSFRAVSLADDSRAGRSLHRTSQYSAAWSPPLSPTVERVIALSRNASSAAARRALPGQENDPFVIPGSLARDVVSIAESVGASLRTVYDVSTKYITRFSVNVASIARDVSHGLSDAHHDDRGASLSRTFPESPPASPDVPSMSALTLCSPPVPWKAPLHLQSASPRDTGNDGDLDRRGHNVRRPSNGLPVQPYVGEPYATHLFPSVADIAPLDDGRSNRRGCDMSYKFESSLLNAATENSFKSTSRRTPALEGGAGVLLPKFHPQAMEGTSAEDVLPAYAETSAPGKDSRFALESRTPYGTAKALSEKHTEGAGPNEKYAFLNAESEQWARNASPIAVHMFSRAAENPAARAVLQSIQGGSRRHGSTPQPPHITQESAVHNASGRAGRVRTRSSAQNDGHDEQSVSSSRGHDVSRYERRARALRNAKLPMPTYDGCADLRRYEEFVFKWDSWIRNRDLGESDSVELMYNALTGEALEWYLSFVAMSDHPWTTREIYQELYEYCFPSNFREELRYQLMSARQDGRPIKRFAKDLQNLAIRFSDVGQSTLKRLLWDGVDPYIRVFWVEKGRSAEYDDYDTLVLYAHRAERREAEIRRCLNSEGAEVETELQVSPRRDNNPDRGVTAHAVRMRQVALQPEEQPVPIGHEEAEYSEGEEEYYSNEEPGHGNNEEELEEDIEAEGAYPQQFDDEYEEGEEEYYYSPDKSESREHESQYSQGDYYDEEYGEAEEQPNEYEDEETYSEGGEERDGEGEDYYNEDGEGDGEYYDDEAGDEDEENGHNGEQPLNTGRNEYGEDEYNSEGSLYENEEEY